MLAFLVAIAFEIVTGSLMAAGVPVLLAVVASGAIGWSLFQKL